MGIVSGFGANPGIGAVIDLRKKVELCPSIIVNVPTGSTVSCTKGTISLTALSIDVGAETDTHTFQPTEEGTWTLRATLGEDESETEVLVEKTNYEEDLEYFTNPIEGNVVPGQVVTFDNKSWIVQHVDGNIAYLASNGILSTGAFNSNSRNAYLGSDLAAKAADYQTNNMSAKALKYCQDVTVNGVTSKVFIPSKAQYESEWSWPSASADNRKQTGGNSWYWTSSPYPNDSSNVWFVDGNFNSIIANYADGGFRPAVAVKFRKEIGDGEYGSSKIAGTLEKGQFVKFDGQDWIVANVSGSTYTLMLKKMTETTAFGSSTTYSGSTIASKCTTFQNAMSANALSVVNSKTVQSFTAKVWIATKSDIESWTDTANPTSSAWSGIRKWSGTTEDDYAVSGIYTYWCSDLDGSSFVWEAENQGNFGSSAPAAVFGFRPCIEVTQS